MKHLLLFLILKLICLIPIISRPAAFTNLQFINNLHQFLALTYSQYNDLNSTQSNYFLIFGGYTLNSTTNKQTLSNQLYQLNLQDLTTQTLASQETAPSARYSACGIVIDHKLYIYGGIGQNDTLLNQLWSYDLNTNKWTQLGNSLSFTQCQCIPLTNKITNDTLGILGLQQATNTFNAIEFDISQQKLSVNISLSIDNSIQISTITWDNKSASSFLRLQSTSQLNTSQFIKIPHPDNYFPISHFCLLFYEENKFNLATDNGMFLLQKVFSNNTYEIVFWKERNQLNDEGMLYCSCLNDWYFFITSSPSTSNSLLQDISIQYLYYPTYTGGIIYKNSPNLYVEWIDAKQYFVSFAYDGALAIMDESFTLFWLEENCGQGEIQNSSIFECSFGLYSCQVNYTGDNCTLALCPGSLQLYDLNNFTVISISCSNNGVCTSNGCQCNTNWTGQDCSIYQNTNCQDQLTSNFLISNCECNQRTTGGNECNVVFCYNDCSGKGTCGQNGICVCKDGYTGPDCSILEIDFSLIG